MQPYALKFIVTDPSDQNHLSPFLSLYAPEKYEDEAASGDLHWLQKSNL